MDLIGMNGRDMSIRRIVDPIKPVDDKSHGTVGNYSEDHAVVRRMMDDPESSHHNESDPEEDSRKENHDGWLDSEQSGPETLSGESESQEHHVLDFKA